MEQRFEDRGTGAMKTLTLVLMTSTALTAVWSLPALAQDGAGAGQPPSNGAAEEIRVTAQRRDQAIEDIPYNISAIGGDEIERANVLDASELLRSVPGVAVVDRGPRNGSVVNNVRIRGINVDSNALGDYTVSAVSTVSTYVNDTPIFANFALVDLDRVEVLRGPQGTLYGSGALGGTVRFITRKPELGEFSGNVSASASRVNGSDGFGWQGTGALNIPLGERAALRLAGSYADYPGIIDYKNLYVLDANGTPALPAGTVLGFDSSADYMEKKDADTLEQSFIRAALKVEPTDNFEATLTVQYQDDEFGGRRQQSFGADGFGNPYDDYENGAVILEPGARDVWLAGLEANLDFGFATLTSSTSYYDHNGDSITDNTGFLTNFANYGLFYYNYPRPLSDANREYGDEAFVQELRLVSADGGRFDYVVGAFYMDQDLSAKQQNFLRGFENWADNFFFFFDPTIVAGDLQFDYSRQEQFEEYALFGEGTFHLSDTVHLTGGFRYYDNTSKADMFQAFPAYGFLAAGFSADSFEDSDTGVLFKANASWDFTPNDMLYATFSQGYRRGGTNAVAISGNFPEDPAWLSYESDSLDNYEIGVKGRHGGLRYNVSGFLVNWDDPQLNTETPTFGYYAVQNAGEAETYGIEFEIDHSLNDRWHYQFGYSYVSAELTEDAVAPDNPLVITAPKGADLPGAPEHIVSFGIDYTVPIPNMDGYAFFLIDGAYQSETQNVLNASGPNGAELDGFAIFNATATLGFNQFDVSLWVKNIGNEEGITGRFNTAGFGTNPGANFFGNTTRDLIALPRTGGVTVRYNF